MKNQKGSAILLAMPLILALGVMAGSYMIWYTSHARLQMRNKAYERSSAISISLKMIYSSRASCRDNLVANGFGTRLSDLTRPGGVSFIRPGTNGGVANTILITSGKSYEELQVLKVEFSPPRTFFAGETSYLSDLQVSYENPITQSVQTFTMPFYFVADSAGNLTDCLLTGYVPVAGTSQAAHYPVTTDDLICTHTHSADYIYLPYNQTCAPRGASVSQN
ncbi:MAG: hypothetical protein JSU04_03340 [Bdellovibrionales bacterium]|nr:hypothetical protein [Bdellovibrionales bacterium]